MKSATIISTAAMLAMLTAIAAPSKKGEKASPAKNRDADRSAEFRNGTITKTTAATFKPERTTPVQTGEFQVDLVVIAFPDCIQPQSVEAVRSALNSLDGSATIADYYKDYSQGITWPVLEVYPTIYTAPHPLGYYCRWNAFGNLLGYNGDGGERARKLREDALKFVQSKGKLKKKGAYTCYVYCNTVNKDPEHLERVIRPLYPPKPSPEALQNGAIDKLKGYDPKVMWADPLWPNSIPQVSYPGNGRTLVHELGHCLGSPDYYHATEEHDGLEGAPCLPWDYGPTGPAYCRFIHHAFVPAAAYPKIEKPGEYTLSPRSAKFPMTAKDGDGRNPLGLFVPSTHPNYLFYIEYCHNERPPVGDSSAEGLLVHVINVTMTSPMLGPPDLCYTYRSGDPDHKAIGEGVAYLRPGDKFDEKSDPAAVLPNFLPAGIAISDIKTDASTGTCTFKLDMPESKFTKQELDFALLPQTELISLDAPMPTSFRAKLNVKYRGEPLLTEYGFCYGLKKDPTEKTGKLFPLYHRDRYEGRIIDLKPGVTNFVRAYARNANGIRYSSNQKGIVLPADATGKGDVTLFSETDHLLSTWYIQQWYFGLKNDVFNSSNPLLALMAIANYYRALPGAENGKGDFDVTRVHSNPSDSRPKFRLAEVDQLRREMEALVRESGLGFLDFEQASGNDDGKGKKKPSKPAPRATGKKKGGPDYGKNAAWVAKCAAALKIKSPETVFFNCPTEEALLAKKDEIRRWILLSQPVMLVRQSRPLNDEISQRWPLDIAIIDGLGFDAETFHVVFPGGSDRGRKEQRGGYIKLGELLYRTSDAMLMFYRPGAAEPAKKRR